VQCTPQDRAQIPRLELKERANMYTVTPVLPPNNRLSIVLARLRESFNLQVRFVINRDYSLGRFITPALYYWCRNKILGGNREEKNEIGKEKIH